MKIEDLDDSSDVKNRQQIVTVDAKRALVGAGARILFYPTLLYNVCRNKIQAEFRWWDQIEQRNRRRWSVYVDFVCVCGRVFMSVMEFERESAWFSEGKLTNGPCLDAGVNVSIRLTPNSEPNHSTKPIISSNLGFDSFLLLGAVPFPKDVPRLKQLGVGGVITLNEPYETLVPTSLYRAHGIDHLVIPTRDYLFAPSFIDIDRAVNFIHKNATSGKTTYVHCKAGRGRSTTIVLCYLVEYKHMTPASALEYVRSRRPRVLLAPSQWKAVQEYKQWRLASRATPSPSGDAVLITKADLEGYRSPSLALVPRAARTTRPMMAKLSCLFASLKVSGGGAPIAMNLTEPPAC